MTNDPSTPQATRGSCEVTVVIPTRDRLSILTEAALPAALARHHVAGARVEQGELQVRFEETVT